MSNQEDAEINDECLLICISLLLGGNAKTQESILNYMKNDETNSLLRQIRNMLINSFEGAKKELVKKN